MEQRNETRMETIKKKSSVAIVCKNTLFNENRYFGVNKKETGIKLIILIRINWKNKSQKTKCKPVWHSTDNVQFINIKFQTGNFNNRIYQKFNK